MLKFDSNQTAKGVIIAIVAAKLAPYLGGLVPKEYSEAALYVIAGILGTTVDVGYYLIFVRTGLLKLIQDAKKAAGEAK